MTRRCSWRMLKPLRRRANSAAVAGRASRAIAMAQKNAIAFQIAECPAPEGAFVLESRASLKRCPDTKPIARSVVNGLLRIIFLDWSRGRTLIGCSRLLLPEFGRRLA